MGERNKRKLCSSSIPFRFRFISKMMETKECKEFEENNNLKRAFLRDRQMKIF